jgi:hypothetical protein
LFHGHNQVNVEPHELKDAQNDFVRFSFVPASCNTTGIQITKSPNGNASSIGKTSSGISLGKDRTLVGLSFLDIAS